MHWFSGNFEMQSYTSDLEVAWDLAFETECAGGFQVSTYVIYYFEILVIEDCLAIVNSV